LDEYTLAYSKEKASPIAKTAVGLLVSVERADRVFFAMVQRGWDGRSHNARESNKMSAQFVWKFLCILFGKCPAKEELSVGLLALYEKFDFSLYEKPGFVLPNGL
jgi:hypothetical protein